MHLTRQKARSLPTFIENPDFDPVEGIALDSSFRIILRLNGNPVSMPVPGWTLQGISLLFYPTVILQFGGANDEISYWYLDATFTFICSNVAELQERVRTRIGQKMAMIACFLGGISDEAMPCRTPDNVQSFLRLSGKIRQEILTFFGYSHFEGTLNSVAGDDFHGFTTASMNVLDGRHYVGLEPRNELRMGGGPVSLVPGWRISSLSSLFFPLFVADLRHNDGGVAHWLFDSQGNHLCDNWKLLSESNTAILAIYAVAILGDLWDDFVVGPSDRTFDHVNGFLDLPAGIRHAIFDLYCSLTRLTPATAIWTTTEIPSETKAYIAQTERGTALLDRNHVDNAISRSIQDQNVILANDGIISWPSPINGSELASSGFAFMVDELCFAYQVKDVEAGLTFYVVAALDHFRTFSLYFPENDLLVAKDPAILLEVQRYKNFRLHLLNHVLNFGAAIQAGKGKPVGELFHAFRGRSAIHIGHFIWQDLSGIHDFLDRVRPDRVPRFLVLESSFKPEIYGPLDTLFPALENKVERLTEAFSDILPGIYKDNQRIFKATSMHVPGNVGKSILSGYKASPSYHHLVLDCQKVREDSDILVLIGLRMGNRTIVDIEAFSITLIAAIYDQFRNAVIIIDGQNTSEEVTYGSFGDTPASQDNFLNQELEIARTLARYASMRGRRLINNIGRPIVESLLWCDASDFFISPWGAALAKYRWVCDKPGLVVTGKWNLRNRPDLLIYHGRQFNQDPSEMWLNDPATVEDDVADGETDWTKVERSNFKVDAEAILRQLLPLLQQRSRARGHPNHE